MQRKAHENTPEAMSTCARGEDSGLSFLIPASPYIELETQTQVVTHLSSHSSQKNKNKRENKTLKQIMGNR